MGLVTHVTDDVTGTVAELATQHPAGGTERGGRDQDAAAPDPHDGRNASALASRCSPATKAARAWRAFAEKRVAPTVGLP